MDEETLSKTDLEKVASIIGKKGEEKPDIPAENAKKEGELKEVINTIENDAVSQQMNAIELKKKQLKEMEDTINNQVDNLTKRKFELEAKQKDLFALESTVDAKFKELKRLTEEAQREGQGRVMQAPKEKTEDEKAQDFAKNLLGKFGY